MEDSKKEYYANLTTKELEVLALQGDPGAQFRLGGRYRRGDGIKKSLTKAVEWYTKAADQGHLGAQNDIGNFYLDGLGVEKDSEKGVNWIAKAAKQGLSYAEKS